MLRAVLDTNVLISARLSSRGASNALLRLALDNRIRLLASIPLFMEYEAVLGRPEHLLRTGLTNETIAAFLDLLATKVEEVKLHYLWRPQLGDPSDEMVLETAINGRADYLVSFNARHFSAASRFGIEVVTPSTILRRIK